MERKREKEKKRKKRKKHKSENARRTAGNRIVRLRFRPIRKDIIYFFFFIYNTCNMRVCIRFVVRSTIAILFFIYIYIYISFPLFSRSSRAVRFPSFFFFFFFFDSHRRFHFLPVGNLFLAKSPARVHARSIDRTWERRALTRARLQRCKNKKKKISVDSTISIYTSIKNTSLFVISKSVFFSFLLFFPSIARTIPRSLSTFPRAF